MSGEIVILHTNDVHGAIAGYAKVAALKAAMEEAGAYVLLMDAGDFIQGDPTVSISEGASAVELMNLAGYDVAAPGNHEFDYGYANLAALADEAEFPIVAANVLYGDTVAFGANTVFTTEDGVKIGVFGLDTPETATKAHPAKIEGVTFLAGEALFAAAQEQVDALEAEGCDYIVCLGHLGIDDESAGNRSVDLLAEVSGIDVFIDGHSHSTMEDIAAVAEGNQVGDTVTASTGTKLANIGMVVLDETGITAQSIPAESVSLTDEAVAARAAEIQAQVDEEYGAVFAGTEALLNGEREPGNRTEETNLGDLITDALVWGAEREGEAVDAAVTNGGGIRASIAAGDITKKDVNTVLPFGNTLSIVKVTGAELLEALEASTYCTPTAIGGFPQVSGIVFTVDAGVAYDQGEQYPGSTYYAPASIGRVSIESVGAGTSASPKLTPLPPMTSWLPAAIPTMPSRLLPSTMIWEFPWMRS
ncbi:MAG: bifunctional metallophosphatase/5'-nucleotidase [Intestinimonas sp.]